MSTEINGLGGSAPNGTGIAVVSGNNTKVSGDPRPASQGKAAAAELLIGKSDPADGSTGSTPSSSEESRNSRVAVAQLNDYVQNIQRNLEFRVDEATNRTVVSVIDRDSQEVIRQIPSEVVLKLAKQLSVMDDGTGFLLEDKA